MLQEDASAQGNHVQWLRSGAFPGGTQQQGWPAPGIQVAFIQLWLVVMSDSYRPEIELGIPTHNCRGPMFEVWIIWWVNECSE